MILAALKNINANAYGQLSAYPASTPDSAPIDSPYSPSQSVLLPLLPLSPLSLTDGLDTPSPQAVSTRYTSHTSVEIKEIAIGVVGGLVATAAVAGICAAFVYGGTALGMNSLPTPAFLALVFGVPSLVAWAVVEGSLASLKLVSWPRSVPQPHGRCCPLHCRRRLRSLWRRRPKRVLNINLPKIRAI